MHRGRRLRHRRRRTTRRGEDQALAAERRSRDAETRLAFDAGRMGSWQWDRDTNAVSWSPELERVFGLDPGSFPGTFEAFIARVHPDDRERLGGIIRGAVENGTEISGDHRIVLDDGTVRWLEARGYAVPGTDARQWIGVGIDITERKEGEMERARLHTLERVARGEAEEAGRRLEEALSRLDALLEHAPVGFGFYDTAYRCVRVNEPLAEMCGVPIEDHVGRPVSEISPAVWDRVRPYFERVLETGRAVIDVEVSASAPAPSAERHWLASFYPVAGPGAEPAGLGAVVVDITRRKRAERATSLVAGADELFATNLDLDTMLDRAVRVVIPELADSSHLYLVSTGGDGRRVAMANRDPSLEPTLVDADRRYPVDLEGDLPTARALRQGQSQLVEVVTDRMRERMARDPAHLEILRRHGVCSVITTPLVVRGETMGVLVLTYTEASGRHYEDEDVELAEELARRFAQVVDRARLAERAERARLHLELLARVGELVTVELDSDARLAALTRLVLPDFADLCVVHLFGEDGEARNAAFAAADPAKQALIDEVDEWLPVPLDAPTPWAECLRSGKLVLTPSVDTSVVFEHTRRERRDLARRLGAASLLSVPLPGPGGAAGAVTFCFAESGRRYDPSHLPVAQELARRAAPAVAHARRYEQERDVAAMLQRSLLPHGLPALPTVELVARYVPAGEELKVGGDWYDVMSLADGAVVLAIGDVAGHGVPAATSMGKISNALRFCVGEGFSPSGALRRLNEHFTESGDADMATLLVLVYDSFADRMRFSSAGHPPPLVQPAGGAPEYLTGGLGTPLCASEHAEYPEEEIALAPGSLVLLYTDGLVERRGEPLDRGLARLRATLERGPDDLELLADHLLAGLVEPGGAPDDVALLVMRARSSFELEVRIPARPKELARMRLRLRQWLGRAGASVDEAHEMTLAASEAAANAVEHAYALEDAEIVVTAALDRDEAVLTVTDAGQWRDADPGDARGRGLELMRGLTDDVRIDRTARGTTVRMRRRLRGAGP